MTVTYYDQVRATSRVYRCDKHPEKLQYRTLDEAFTVAEDRAPKEGVPIYVYACDHCGFFHLSKKKGTENIGRHILNRADASLWSTETGRPPVKLRDDRYVDTGPGRQSRAKLIVVIRAAGTPDSMLHADLKKATGLASSTIATQMGNLGWAPSGATRNRCWHRQPELAPKYSDENTDTPPTGDNVTAMPEWETVPLDTLKDLTVSQLMRTFAAVGKDFEVRIR